MNFSFIAYYYHLLLCQYEGWLFGVDVNAFVYGMGGRK